MSRSFALLIAASAWSLGAIDTSRAAPVVHMGSDPGVGRGQPAPGATEAAASFRAAVAASSVTDFEGASLGHFGNLDLAPGVSATLTNTVALPPPGFHYGIADDNQGARLGYNVTPGGSQFLRFVPVLDVGTATLQFNFDRPIDAFGFYVTGLGTNSGPLHVTYGTGSGAEESVLTGEVAGGILFFGVSGLAAPITRLSLEFREVRGMSRDVIGVDDLRFRFAPAAVPEPATIALLLTLLPALWAARRWCRPGM